MLDIVAELILLLGDRGRWINTDPILLAQEIAVGMGGRRQGEGLNRKHVEARDHLPTGAMVGPL